MATRFRGEETAKMDAKSRVAIPAAFRRVLAEGTPDGGPARVVINYGEHLDGFCRCYSEESFQSLEDRILAMQDGTTARMLLQRFVLRQSLTATIDDTGRIVLPAKVKDRTGLPDKEPDSVYFGGMGDHFELWREDLFEARDGGAASAALARLPAGFDLLALIENPDALAGG